MTLPGITARTEEVPSVTPSPYHRYPGSSKARQEVGNPGYDELSLAVGHVLAHPELGCADCGCDAAHDEN